MRAHPPSPAMLIAAVLLGPWIAEAQVERAFSGPPQGDRPKIAIIQYESGRVVVVREVNGELQALEPGGGNLEALQRFLDPVRSGTAMTSANQAPAGGVRPTQGQVLPGMPADVDGSAAAEDYPFYYNPYGYAPHEFVNTNEGADASREGRALERLEQRAAEARQQVMARRRHVGETGMTNLSGSVFPLTAAQRDQAERIAGATAVPGSAADVTGSPYISFYSLGFGLEEYRQQELAARKELALLSHDVLLREGLAFFGNRQYGQAARSFIGAALKDQGDPASRLYAAQALMANGLYGEAMVHVRRAFELMPALLHRPLDHRAAYVFPEDFDTHLAELQAYVDGHPRDGDAAVLLAYETFFGGEPFAARQALIHVRQRAAGDPFARKLLAAAQPVVGRL